jgi:DNA-binding LacI/PurR family transcriptional regulator
MDIYTNLRIKKDGEKKVYKEIAEKIRRNIIRGYLKRGDRLPSEIELSKNFGVSRQTLRRAIDELVEEGFIERKHGSGTYITSPKLEKNDKKLLIGILVYKTHDNIPSPQISYFTSFLKKKNCLLTIYQVADYGQLEDACEEIVEDKSVSGIISLSIFSEGDRDLIEYLQKNKIYVLSLGRRIDTAKIDWIIVDSSYGSYKMTEYLIKNGHRKINLLVNEPVSCVIWDRIVGFKLALLNYGIEFDEKFIIDCKTNFFEDSKEKAYKKIKEILKKGNDLPTAIFSVSDAGAIGAIKALKEEGYKIPEDISICGFDDIPLAEDFNLTTVKTPYYQMTKKAVEIIMENIRKQIIIPEEPKKEIFKPEIVIRGSVKEI